MLKLGEQNVKELYLGEQEIKKAYLGEELMFSAAKPSRLPDGYTEVEYISNPNLTYINISGLLPYTIQKSWELEFELTDLSQDIYLVGASLFKSSTDYSYNYLRVTPSSAQTIFRNTLKSGSLNSGNSCIWDIPSGKSVFSFHETAKTATLNGISRTPVLTGRTSRTCLFALGGSTNSSVSNFSDYKLFSFRLLNDSATAITAEYVPAIRESDGAVGLFLLGSESTFLQSSVSGKNFEAGPVA